MRIVTTTCSNTEIVCALGCADWIVGVDQHSDFPEEVVERAAKVGPDLGIDPEKVAALEPDLVIASLTVPGHEKVVESLETAGLPVIAPAPKSVSDVYDDIEAIAERLGVPERGRELAAAMREEIGEIPKEPVPGAPRIQVEWWPKPVIVAARRSWVSDLLRAAGGVNPWESVDDESRAVEPDEVRQASPDATVISWCGVPFEKYRASEVQKRAWDGIPARDQVHLVPEAFLGRPGPRLVDGFRALREIVEQTRRGSSDDGVSAPLSGGHGRGGRA